MPETPLPLGGGITALVTAEHRFGSDAVLLADFARPKRRDIVCDLGTGCGILPLLWCRRDPPAHIDAVELQPEAAALAAEAVCLNHLEERITVHCADPAEIGTDLPQAAMTASPVIRPISDAAAHAPACPQRKMHAHSPDTNPHPLSLPTRQPLLPAC